MRDIYEVHKEMGSSNAFRNCGIICGSAGFTNECGEKTDEENRNVLMVPPLDTLSTNDGKDELWEEGLLRISTDGSVDYPEDQRLARGGAGIYFGNKHPHNTDFAVSGVDMNSYRTKLQAVSFMLDGAKEWDTNIWITLYNEAVVNQINAPIKRGRFKMFRERRDLERRKEGSWAPRTNQVEGQLVQRASTRKGHQRRQSHRCRKAEEG